MAGRNASAVSAREERGNVLEKLLRMYTCAMAFDTRSPMPHLVGPPGCGKSQTVEQMADLLGVQLHILNVSRLSPLEIEGVMMPHGSGSEMILKMLPATFWTQLREGDILLMDEFLRGFPEVYNGLLDIFTSRRVGAFVLPKVFIIGASNSVVAYDAALEDRLMHVPVPDPRKSNAERNRLAEILVDAIGLHPDMAVSSDMSDLLDVEVMPMFELLDQFKKQGAKGHFVLKGTSLRNLIGQAQLRTVQSTELKNLISVGNGIAMHRSAPQYVVLLGGKPSDLPHGDYIKAARGLRGNPKLTPLQATNLEINLQLIEFEAAKHEEESGD
jgi:hypothetical protein